MQLFRSSRRDKLTASAVGGAIGALVCSPPYTLGRIAILMLGSHRLRVLAVLLLAIAIVLQTGATTATKATKTKKTHAKKTKASTAASPTS